MKWIFSITFLLTQLSLFAQPMDSTQTSSSADTSNSRSIIPLPIAFYLPETRLGFGGLVNLSYTSGKYHAIRQKTNPSSIQLGGAYTLNKQILLYLSYKVFSKENNYYGFGEVGYYVYNYNFYGVGNFVGEHEEIYDVNYPRIQLNFLRRIARNSQKKISQYVGPRYWFENYDIQRLDSTGLLFNENILGIENNITSAIGAVYFVDSRDNVFFPSSGITGEMSFQYDHPSWGSNYKFARAVADVSWYHQLKWKDIIATNVHGSLTFGGAPFSKLSLLGGTKRMRGYYEGRYRDDNSLVLQSAYRKHLFWRIGAEAFASIGSVFPQTDFSQITKIRFAGGAGIRLLLDKKRKINLRIDYGFGYKSSGLYVTLGEAF